MTPPTLGQRIRAARTDRGLTLRETARRVGISAPYLSDIEYDRRCPAPPKLYRIARVIRVPIAELQRLLPRRSVSVREYEIALGLLERWASGEQLLHHETHALLRDARRQR